MNVLDFKTINVSYPEPYLGLNPFSEQDEPFFFGRDKQKIIIARNLKISRLTVLFGESGVGKSSILQAGVVPQLGREAENNCKEYGFPSLVVVVCSDWHKDPLSMLTKRIHASVAEAIKIPPQNLELKTTLSENIAIWTERLAGNKKSETPSEKKEKGKILIILDQFDEYFWHRSQESETKRFVDEFSQVVNHPDLRANFIIAIRHDSLAKLKSFQGKILGILDNLLELKRLDKKSARNAIVKPIGEYNIRRIITEKLIDSPLTLLSAESGMGKTSILNKGVVAPLSQVAKKNSTDFGASKFAVVIFSLWRSDLVDYDPASQLLNQVETVIEEIFPDVRKPQSGLSFSATLQAWAQCIGKGEKAGKLFIIIDQFEEYLQYYLQGGEKDTFLDELKQTIECADKVNFLISVHEDALSLLKELVADLDIAVNHLRLKQTDEHSKLDDFTKPIEETSSLSAQIPAVKIEKQLVEEVLDQVKVKHHNNEIEAALLQLVMDRLWQEEIVIKNLRCLKSEALDNLRNSLEELSGTQRIVKDYLEDKMEKLSPEQEQLAAKIFHYMVTPEGSKIAYSALELAKYVKKDERNINKENLDTLSNKLQTFLDKLTEPDFRLLRSVKPSQAERTYYEIFHDMYAKPILAWQARYEWKKMEREAEAEQKKRIEEAKKQAKLIREEGRKKASRFKIQADLANLQAEKAERRAKQANQQIEQAEQKIQATEQRAKQKIQDAERRAELIKQKAKQTVEKANQKVKKAELEAQQRAMKAKQASSWIVFIAAIVGVIFAIRLASNQISIINEISEISKIRELSKTREVERNIAQSPTAQSINYRFLRKVVLAGNKLQQSKLSSQIIGIGSTYSDQKFSAMRILASILSQGENSLLSGEEIYPGNKKVFISLSFSPDGKQIIAGTDDGKLYLWNLQDKTAEELKTLPSSGEQPILSLSFSPDGKQLATGSKDGIIRLWNLQDKIPKEQEILSSSGERQILSLSFSRDGKQLAASSEDGKLYLWNLQNKPSEKQEILSSSGERQILSLSFSRDGKQLAAGSKDGKLYLWNLQNKSIEDSEIITDSGKQPILSLSFSPDGKQLAAGSANGILRLWKLKYEQKNKPSEEINTNPSKHGLKTLNFSRNGEYFAVVLGSSSFRKQQESTLQQQPQQQIDLWDVQSKQLVYSYPLRSENEEIIRISFSSDGKQLTTVAENGAVKLLPIYTFDELLDKACNLLYKNQPKGSLSDECKSR